jgi:hypothetical protein
MKTYSKEEYKVRLKAKDYYLISLKGKKDVGLFKINKNQLNQQKEIKKT